MSRYAYTAAAFVLMLVLTATHWKAYTAGRAMRQAEYNQAVAAATERAREREQALVAAKNEAEVRYAQLKKRNAADAAGTRTELDSLRHALSERQARADSSACPGVDGSAGLERELFGHCAQALVELAGEADRLEALVVGLQGYVKSVCMAK